MLLPHCATRTLATPSATRQSPVGSAAKAEVAYGVSMNTDRKMVSFTMFRGQCNMGQNLCLRWWYEKGQNAVLGIFS
jgi:hypothetical protein